jgi:nucleotide-binding universal stress UspA family protein
MVRRILVPLTERLADPATFRAIMDVARSSRSTIRLLYIAALAPEPEARPLPAAGQGDEQGALVNDEGVQQIGLISASLGDIPVERVIRFGDVETAILKEAAAWPADLVVLSAGDRMWLSRAVRTGRAAQAFRRTAIPALLYTPSPC